MLPTRESVLCGVGEGGSHGRGDFEISRGQ